jgi:phosphoribosylanthranilate isomerase
MRLWIKICANTSLEDALLAVEAGADAVGFVFAPSPRRVTVEQVAAIAPHLPATVEKIGVFVDAALDEIEATVRACGLTGVQLHFEAAPDLPAKLRDRLGPELRILRVVHFDVQQSAERDGFVSGHGFKACPERSRTGAASGAETTRASAPEACFQDPAVDAILVDSCTATAVGGTGETFDWELARKTLFQSTGARTRLIAAGGLHPENVAEALATLRPWGVDVASGVEAAPGKKDPAKVREFVARARAAGGIGAAALKNSSLNI